MQVVKRNGAREPVSFDKILRRIERVATRAGLAAVDVTLVAQQTIRGLHDGVSTRDLDVLASENAASMMVEHPDYGTLAAHLAISNLHREVPASFVEVMERLHHYERGSLISDHSVMEAVRGEHGARIAAAIDYGRDYDYEYFGLRTLMRSYLLRIEGEVAERPQHMLMRVSLGIHGPHDIESALRTYDLMSRHMFTHASPTLFNAGTPRPQCSSCFLLTMTEDSIEGIYETLGRCASISKLAGGIGISVHTIRATGSYIAGTNGSSNGLVPMLQVYNATARYVDQGGGKRKGAFAVYLEPWHADVFEFIDLRKNTGKEERRARDLFLGLWVPDLFMRRVETNGVWSLMCPAQSPGLADCWGAAFDELYERYEAEGRYVRQVSAQDLWFAILDAQIETGVPYMLFKDACNGKSNQQNLGTIRSSNLCTEIIEYTSPDEVAVCNLASIALPKFVSSDGKSFDHELLRQVTRQVARNLDRIIDVNHYPLEAARRSNMRHRPIGIGIQGLADVFLMLRLPFDSEEAERLQAEIMETIYYGAIDASIELAQEYGAPYETYEGSPASQGVLQFDMWPGTQLSGRWDWDALKERMRAHGLRNSLVTAPMPTASTASILGNCEAFEPYTSNVFVRRVLAGEYAVVNRHLVRDLMARGLWTAEVRTQIIAANGSIQAIEAIPEDIRLLYRTVWELRQRRLIDMAAARGPFIDQSQSFSVHLEAPTPQQLTSCHFYSWRAGLKTGMYYLRSRPAADPIKFGLLTCSLDESCDSCGA